ncbi:Chloroperoxidase [Biscogniauxia mediterranea]|nr:Chloroperoxidase [Biscogniauxia mediterranea]
MRGASRLDISILISAIVSVPSYSSRFEMRFTSFLALASTSLALPRDINPYSPAGATDSRSPCPLLNTLANHGYLPHDGRNISIADIASAIFASTNWSPDFGTVPGQGAFGGIGNPPTIDLEQLDDPAATEHPASLTRDDASPSGGNSNSLTLDPARLQALLDDSPRSAYITVASLARSRNRVEAITRRAAAASGGDGDVGDGELTDAQRSIALGEASLLLLLMLDGDVPDAGAGDKAVDYAALRADKEMVRAWLREERFPVELGWAPSARVVQLADVAPLSDAIAEAQGEDAEGGGGPYGN